MSVLLAGRQWDLLSATIASLTGRGRFNFIGPVNAVEPDSGASLVLASPEFRIPRREASLEQQPPVLLCVPWESLESHDLYEIADDFVVVPCSAAELAKRMRRLAGRGKAEGETPAGRHLRAGEVTLDQETYQVSVNGRQVDLAWMEFQLLRFLMEHPGRVFRRDEILQRVWGTDYLGGARTVDVHIRRLRHKLGEDGERGLRTVRNVGYGMDMPE